MYKCKIIGLALFVFICLAQSQNQRIGEWRSYTSMKEARSVIIVGSKIWAATSGGVFVFDPLNNTYTKYTNVEGLGVDDTRVIAYDNKRYVWVGTTNGWVNVFDLINQTWKSIRDIADKKEYSNRNINSFYFKGDSVFIISEFGVSVFDPISWSFPYTYVSFGFSSTPFISNMTIYKDLIWVGTNQGLASAPLSSPYPWNIYTSFGQASNAVTSLTVFNDTLLIGTAKGLSYFYNGSFTAISSFNGYSISELKTVDGKLYILSTSTSNQTVIEVRTSVLGGSQTTILNSEVQGVSIAPTTSMWIATTSKGIAKWDGTAWNYFYPNGPNSNLFNSIIIDDAGVLWGASGSNTPAGFYRFNATLPNNIQWKNFPSYGGGCYRVSRGSSGSVWVSSWGEGFIEVAGDSIRRKLDSYSTPSLPGAKADIPRYVVAGAATIDNQGKTWLTNRVEDNSRSLLRLDDETSATFFDNKYKTEGWFHSIVIDQNGTKWLGGNLPWETNGRGLFIFNENPSVLNGIQTIGGWGYITDANGLKNNAVLTFAVDNDGAVWVGTSQGISIITNPQYPKQITTCYALQLIQPLVQSIAVDGLNNKWIGTKEGVYVVNSDGTQLLQFYDVASTNRRLLSNDVRSIAIDQKNGIAYFGTEQGLSSLGIGIIQPVKSFSELEIGPNPFVIPNNQELIIKNLVANSSLKIMTIDGIVVKQFDAQGGGNAFWDGRDKNNSLVPTGIYFIIAYAENGKQIANGKVAVIRK